MLNEHLFENEKDKEIARLKLLIEDFKKYDMRRKEYYSKKMQRLGELESLLEEMKENASSPLEELVIKQKEEIKRLHSILTARAIEDKRTQDELTEIILADEYKRQNKELRKREKGLRETIDKMVERLEEFDDVQTVYTNMKPAEEE